MLVVQQHQENGNFLSNNFRQLVILSRAIGGFFFFSCPFENFRKLLQVNQGKVQVIKKVKSNLKIMKVMKEHKVLAQASTKVSFKI